MPSGTEALFARLHIFWPTPHFTCIARWDSRYQHGRASRARCSMRLRARRTLNRLLFVVDGERSRLRRQFLPALLLEWLFHRVPTQPHTQRALFQTTYEPPTYITSSHGCLPLALPVLGCVGHTVPATRYCMLVCSPPFPTHTSPPLPHHTFATLWPTLYAVLQCSLYSVPLSCDTIS